MTKKIVESAESGIVATGKTYRVTANSMHSQTFRGRVELGNYSSVEHANRRLTAVKLEGYREAVVEEVNPG